MQALSDFALKRPASLDEAAALLAAEPLARLVAGGTDLLPNLRRGLERPAMLIDMSGLQGFDAIEAAADGSLTLGGGVTLATIACDATLAERLPALRDAARSAAGPGRRTAATLAGNLCQDTRCIFYNQNEGRRASHKDCLKRGGDTCHVAPEGDRCHAAFSGDIAPVLLALGAEAELCSARGARRIALDAMYRDDGAAHLAIGRDELLARLRVPAPAAGAACRFHKARARGAMDFALATVAVALALRDGRIASLRIGLSGTNSHPLLLAGTAELAGQAVDDALVARVGKLVQKQVSPMRSSVTPSSYRRQVAAVLTQRLLRELAGAPSSDGAAR